MGSKSNNFLNHFLTIGTGTILNMLIGLITTPVITRLVGEDVYGQFSIFTMYVSIGEMILCMGLDQGIIRFYHEQDSINYRRKLIRASCFIPIIATIITTIVAVALSKNGVVKFEFDTFVMSLLGMSILVQIVNRLNMVQLRAAYRTKEYSVIRVTHRLIYVVLVLLFIAILHRDHFHSMITATIFSYIFVLIYGIYVLKPEWKFWDIREPRNFNYKGLYKYSAPYVISMGVTTLFQAIDKISLNQYCSYAEVGIYASANNIVNIFSIIQTTFNALWTPMAIEYFQKNPEDRSFYQRGNRLITVVMFFIGATLILGKDIFVLLLGESYRSAVYVIPFLIFHPIMYTVSETTVSGIVFYKKSNMQIVVAAISCITNICGNTLLVPIYGGRGAAISTGLSYIVFFLLRTLISKRYYPVDWKLKKFFVLTFIMIGYAFYNTFFDNVAVNIIGYFAILFTLYVLYKDVIEEGLHLGISQLKSTIKKE